jgi:hypothetical protein
MRAPLSGDNLVRIVFLDEAGRSCGEPMIVVAGPIVHGDRTYRRLAERLDDIRSQFIPAADRKNFLFHAKDIYHGGGQYFKNRKDEWPPLQRFALLRTLAEVPRDFGLPITFGALDKQSAQLKSALHEPSSKAAGIFVDSAEHAVAFGWAIIGAERQMHLFPRDEIGMIIAEDTDRTKKAVKYTHSMLRDAELVAQEPRFSSVPGLPLSRIVDTPHFAAKTDSAPLQIADTCAFLIMRRLIRRSESQEFFELIAPQLIWAPSVESGPVFGEPMGSEQIATGQRY